MQRLEPPRSVPVRAPAPAADQEPQPIGDNERHAANQVNMLTAAG
jgi:hypothetical protein